MSLRACSLMTGPISVAKSQGFPEPQLVHDAIKHVEEGFGDILLKIKHPQCRTALPGGLEGGGNDIAHRLLGQRGAVDDHGVKPAGLGNQRRIRGEMFGHGAVDRLRRRRRAGEAHPIDARVGHQRRAHDGPGSRQQLQGACRNARLQKQAGGDGGGDRRAFGRFGQNPVTGGQGRGSLAGENRQRKIPWRKCRANRPRAGVFSSVLRAA